MSTGRVSPTMNLRGPGNPRINRVAAARPTLSPRAVMGCFTASRSSDFCSEKRRPAARWSPYKAAAPWDRITRSTALTGECNQAAADTAHPISCAMVGAELFRLRLDRARPDLDAGSPMRATGPAKATIQHEDADGYRPQSSDIHIDPARGTVRPLFARPATSDFGAQRRRTDRRRLLRFDSRVARTRERGRRAGGCKR